MNSVFFQQNERHKSFNVSGVLQQFLVLLPWYLGVPGLYILKRNSVPWKYYPACAAGDLHVVEFSADKKLSLLLNMDSEVGTS